jgi:hypothetical protein
LTGVGVGSGSEDANGAKDSGTYSGKGCLQLWLSSNAEASQNARRSSSPLVKARVRVMLRSPKTGGASTRGWSWWEPGPFVELRSAAGVFEVLSPGRARIYGVVIHTAKHLNEWQTHDIPRLGFVVRGWCALQAVWGPSMPWRLSVIYDAGRKVVNVHKAPIIKGCHGRRDADGWCGTHSLFATSVLRRCVAAPV